MVNKNYYLGLDLGTDSVGYAVTDTTDNYNLIKFKGEPMWGVQLFEEANPSDERRSFRTARRRLDRKQQRIKLLQELFAEEIAKVDDKFYKRISESALLRTDAEDPGTIFNDTNYTDADYHKEYPTIHHLISELIYNKEPHDVRLIYIACAWLITHRGHFLNDVSEDNIDSLMDFNAIYKSLMDYFEASSGDDYVSPWTLDDGGIEKFGEILKSQNGITKKYKTICAFLLDGKKPRKDISPEFQFSLDSIIGLLSGKKCKASEIFGKDEYSEIESFALSDDDEKLDDIMKGIGDDAGLIIVLKSIFDWALLANLLGGYKYISESKVAVYDRHKKDLNDLKIFIKKYYPEKYNLIFRDVMNDNYTAYSGNTKCVKETLISKYKKGNSQEAFCEFLTKVLSLDETLVAENKIGKEMYDRIIAKTFMPKQVNGNNRVIPYQVYFIELKRILENASLYLPFLNSVDTDGYITKNKILSIMKYRVPYFVGPLNSHNNEHAWIERKKEGKIYPWNFDEMVDLEKSEQRFIDRMTNTCSYLAGEDVIPKRSFLYEKFEVLNEINNLKINGKHISVDAKQNIYNSCFTKKKNVTLKQIKAELCSKNYCTKEDAETLSGVDITIKSSLQSKIAFNRLISNGIISESDADEIITRITYCEDKNRIRNWIAAYYPQISEEDRKYLSNLNFKDFGRLSKKLLFELEGADVNNGEINTVIGFMWERNVNLSELLLSDNYTFKSKIEELNSDYYEVNSKTLSERLNDMYISNSVKRPIIRTVEIVNEIVKAAGRPPEKIFVEMARGANEKQKNKRTKSRREQLLELYKEVKDIDIRELEKQLCDKTDKEVKNIDISELEKQLGDKTDNDLQSDKLYLYFVQLGRCMYSDRVIDIERLGSDKLYDIDHIYPQSFVKDDSILNNKVLVCSEENHKKGNKYPIASDIRVKMYQYWTFLKDKGMITEEKYKRLVRNTPFTEEEEWNFINRQLVETRQSSKAIAEILGEKYPDSKVVYVKAGLVSDFRHENGMLKSRAINDLHHAKDAYLNVVCGNAYAEKFTREWFLKVRGSEQYTVNPSTMFKHDILIGNSVVWRAGSSLESVRKNICRNNVHLNVYAFCRHGGFFDQQPVSKAEGLIPRKAGLSTEKYGGCCCKYHKEEQTSFWYCSDSDGH